MKTMIRLLTVLCSSIVLVAVVAAIGSDAREAAAQQAAPPSAEALLTEMLDDLGGRQLALTKLTVPPGSGSMEHRHAAILAVYVLSGHIESAVDGDQPTLYGPGDVWYESHMQLHSTFRNPSSSETATALVFAIRDADHPAVVGSQ